jgi:uncharacterized protein YdeI (YjbR/CyaY-like superfamily)
MREFHFKNKEEMLSWFSLNHQSEPIWVIFDKRHTPNKLTQEEALDIALCYGWIDGLVHRIDGDFFKKYFSPRRPKSIWSTKNKRSIERLINDGLMTAYGYKVIEIAKKNGFYQKGDDLPDDFSIEDFSELIKHHEKAYQNFMNMSYSIQRIYALTYYTAKQQATRDKRLNDVILRLEKNLKPMEQEK